MDALFKRVMTGEFQDEENAQAAAQALGKAVRESWTQPNDALVLSAHQALLRAIDFPEQKQTALCGSDASSAVASALARAHVADNEDELPGLFAFIVRALAFNAQSRREVIATLACGVHYRGANVTLLRLGLDGLRACFELSPISPANSKSAMAILTQQLLPLHAIQGKISPTQSVLGAFHRELTLCCSKACYLANSSEAWEMVIVDLATTHYPNMAEGNSPKEVLFLHELETLVAQSNKPLTGKARAALATRLLQCAGSLHAAVCERALSFWRSDDVLAKLQGSDQLLSKTCDRALAKTSLEHWSPTVQSMAGAALLRSSPSMTTTTSADSSTMSEAIQRAKERERAAMNEKPPETLPLPKTFSSTSVIRDATEPFAFGAFGAIWKGRAIVPGATKAQWPLVALKELDDPSAAKKEAEAMQLCGSHPNLVTLLGLFETRKGASLSLVLDFVDGPGDLHTCVVERGPLPLDTCKLICGEIGAGLNHIHSRGVVFGDVKPENVLITTQGHVKLCDFGSAFPIKGKSTQTVGTVEYMPPEQVSSAKGDWWALGCVAHFIMTGRPPVFFDSEAETDLASAFARAVTFADQQGGSLIKDASGRQLVGALCSRAPNKRPEDGGESLSFFDGFRPWSTLSERTGVVLPPAKQGASKQAQGPWQRRTFSTIHSPMPQNYSSGDAQFLAVCLGGGPVKPIADLVLPQDWSVAGTMVAALERAFQTIPKQRVAAPVTETSSAANQRKKMRGAGPSNDYTVAGVNLIAG